MLPLKNLAHKRLRHFIAIKSWTYEIQILIKNNFIASGCRIFICGFGIWQPWYQKAYQILENF